MKNLLKAFAFAFAISTCYNCSVEPADIIEDDALISQEINVAFNSLPNECTNQDPQARLTNNSLLVADFEVFDNTGMLLTHAYGVTAGDASSLLSFPDGVRSFVISTSTSTKAIEIDMGSCMVFEVSIDENNQIDTDQAIQL